MDKLLSYLLVETQGSVLVFLGILATAGVLLLYATQGGRRGLVTALVYLIAFCWALMIGVTAGRSVADGITPFWSLDTVLWGLGGVLLLFVPTWLLLQFGIQFVGIFLLPVPPTDRAQCEKAGRTLRSYMWGLNYPFYREEDGELRKVVDAHVELHGWGPGFVMTSSHYAILLTAKTRNTRVGGDGLIFTRRKEQPLTLVDLRPQVRPKTVRALTRDGISIKVPMVAVFQIDPGAANGDGLYPFDPDAVFAAVHAQGVGPQQEEEGEALGWDQIVVDRAADLLKGVIARTLLDRLLEGEEEDGKPPREALRAGVKDDLAQVMKPHGIKVLGISLGDIEVEDEAVLKQRAKSWGARWERRRTERKAQGNAESIRLIEEARAEAQRQMIMAITEAFQQLADTGTPVRAHVIALRFIDVLEDVAASPPVQELLPETIQGLPAQLRLLVERTAAEDKDQTAE